jgi:large subunit ribosomal protein L4
MATTVKIEALPELLIEQPNPLHIQESYLRQVANGTPFTASKKNKSRVTGSTAKIYRQKGTGRARQGERTNVHMRGGALAFPPLPRLQTKKMNKHTRRSAVRSAVLHHVQAGSAWRIDGADFAGFEKTKQVATVLENTGARSVTLVIPVGAEVKRSCRNIDWVRVVTPLTLNVRDLVESDSLVFSSEALQDYQSLLELQNNPPEEEIEIDTTEMAASYSSTKPTKADTKAKKAKVKATKDAVIAAGGKPLNKGDQAGKSGGKSSKGKESKGAAEAAAPAPEKGAAKSSTPETEGEA